MKRVALIIAIVMVLLIPIQAFAATTADVTVTATPSKVSITVLPITYDFGPVAESTTPSTTTSFFAIDNTSSVQTDQTISVTTTNWSGGTAWNHAEDAIPGADLAGLKANKGGTRGVSDIVVKNGTPNYIAENQAANTDYSFGLKLYAPTSFTDGVQKQIIVRVTAAAG